MNSSAERLDLRALGPWLAQRGVPDPDSVRIRLLAGGRSNLTYALDLPDGRRWVLRRPPVGHVLQSAHDVLREYRVLTALNPTSVPVPAVHGTDEGALIGVPFYVMDYVDGVVPTSAEAIAGWGTWDRRRCGFELIDALAALHELEPSSVGLGQLGRQDGYLPRQLARWSGQLAQSTQRSIPEVNKAHDRLAASCPSDSPTTLVHGDYHIGNCIFGADGRLRAVLDWEMCTRGDAIADLAMMLMYWGRDGAEPVVIGSPTGLAGFPEPSELCARYEQRRGISLPSLSWYLAFANWRLACIVEGVLTRVTLGAMGDVHRFDLDWLRQTPVERARVALALLG